MIYVGIDDTDNENSPGTNKVARTLIAGLLPRFAVSCPLIARHQLLFDPRVPYTKHNSCGGILLDCETTDSVSLVELSGWLAGQLTKLAAPGSDPGLCVATSVSRDVLEFARRCQTTVVARDEAEALAKHCGLYLRGLGGTRDGVIGALAAVGLLSTGDDGRIVQIGRHADDLSGVQEVSTLWRRGVDEVVCSDSGVTITSGTIDIGKRLRPARRRHRVVLFAERHPGVLSDATPWRAVRLP